MEDIIELIEILETITLFGLDIFWGFIIALFIFGVVGELTGASSFTPYARPYNGEDDSHYKIDEDKL